MRNNKDMVSVVIPQYNVESYISRCLDSVLSQSYNDIEIIVVDDCSTDGSVDVVKQYREHHPDIRLIRHDRNLGPMMARRDGYEAATGDFIMFVDPDDTLPLDAICNLVSCQRAALADIVVGNALKHNEDGTEKILLGGGKIGLTKTDLFSAVIEQQFRPQLWGKLFRSELFHDGSLQNYEGMTLAEDVCLLYQLMAKSETIVPYDGIVYDYYCRKDSLSSRPYGEKEVEYIIIAYKMMETAFGQYAELQEKLQRWLTYLVFRLYVDIADVVIAKVRRLLRKHGMQQYGSLRYAGRYLGVKDYWFLLKRYVYVRTVLGKY